jgi:cholesterol transport system auxiliary component
MSAAARARGYLACCVLLGSLCGCALTGKADALYPRFFSPELDVAPVASPAGVTPPLALRLGRVEAVSYVEERFAYRVEPSELSYHEDRRWTEPPERYLRRALERELFQQRGIVRTVSGPGATLDVELTAFEELRSAPPRVRLVLSFSLHDDRRSQLERRVVVERPLPPSSGNASAREVTAALALALSVAVSDISDQVTRELRVAPRTPCAEVEAEEPAAKALRAPGTP